MRLTTISCYCLLLIFLLGCASMYSPSSSLIDEKPVVKIGSASSPSADQIVFIPANVEFPIRFSVKGAVFNEPVTSAVMVSFKEDLYLYKYWASRDGKTWVNSHELLKVEPSGGFDASGGKVEVKLSPTQ
jgi:hypothetical protein